MGRPKIGERQAACCGEYRVAKVKSTFRIEVWTTRDGDLPAHVRVINTHFPGAHCSYHRGGDVLFFQAGAPFSIKC